MLIYGMNTGRKLIKRILGKISYRARWMLLGTFICGILLLIIDHTRIPESDEKAWNLRLRKISAWEESSPKCTSNRQLPSFVGEAPKRDEDNIFFVESSCGNFTAICDSKLPEIILSPMHACAIESAARTNPKANIYLLYLCPLDEGSLERSSKLVQWVFGLPNVRYWHQSFDGLFEGTPLQEFNRNGILQKSQYAKLHASDVLRILLVWKYGGAYLDLDFIMRRSLTDLDSNYVAAEDNRWLNCAAIRLSTTGLGKEVAEMWMEELRTNFNGDIVLHNGPDLVKRLMQKLCGEKEITEMTKERCRGFTIYPPTVFYPVQCGAFRLLFDASQSDATMDKVLHSHGVHLWNSQQATYVHADYEYGSRQPIVLLQREFCPIAYEHNPKQAQSSTFRIVVVVCLLIAVVLLLFFLLKTFKEPLNVFSQRLYNVRVFYT